MRRPLLERAADSVFDLAVFAYLVRATLCKLLTRKIGDTGETVYGSCR